MATAFLSPRVFRRVLSLPGCVLIFGLHGLLNQKRCHRDGVSTMNRGHALGLGLLMMMVRVPVFAGPFQDPAGLGQTENATGLSPAGEQGARPPAPVSPTPSATEPPREEATEVSNDPATDI